VDPSLVREQTRELRLSVRAIASPLKRGISHKASSTRIQGSIPLIKSGHIAQGDPVNHRGFKHLRVAPSDSLYRDTRRLQVIGFHGLVTLAQRNDRAGSKKNADGRRRKTASCIHWLDKRIRWSGCGLEQR
jgi:hypothetical protein